MYFYDVFIKKCKTQTLPLDCYTEIHHIIPKHVGGDDSESNLIRLTYFQHTLAHLLLYRKFNRPEDLCAYKLMRGLSESRKIEIGKMVGEINKRSGHIYRLGAQNAKTGWINEIKTFESLSKGGKRAGRIAVETGQIHRIRTPESCRKGGITQGNRAKASGQIQQIAKYKGKWVLIMPNGDEYLHAFEAEAATGICKRVISSRCRQGHLGYSKRLKLEHEKGKNGKIIKDDE